MPNQIGDGRETGCFHLSIVLFYNQLLAIFPNRLAPIRSLPFPGHHLISAAVVTTASHITSHQMAAHVSTKSVHTLWCLLRLIPGIFRLPRGGQLPGRLDTPPIWPLR
jgi:hypothetical protein